jgi:hypothetical protein
MSDAQVLNLRNNPALMDKATLAYGTENAGKLSAVGLSPTNANVGMAHGFGFGGAEAILRAPPGALASTVLPAGVISANRLQGKTVGDIEGDFARRFGTGQFDASSGAASATPPVARFSEPPPHFTPGQNPIEWKTSYEAWGDRLSNAYAAGNPTEKSRMMASIRQYATEQEQTYTALRTDAVNQLATAAVGDPTVTDVSQLPAQQVQWLTGREKVSLQEEINRAREGTGGFYSTAQQAAATAAEGQALTDPAGFSAHPEKWLSDPDLSFHDRGKFAEMAARLRDKTSRESERAMSWQTYYSSSPLVHNLYSFIGTQQRDAIGNQGGIGTFDSPQSRQARFAKAFMYEVEHGNYQHEPDGRLKPEEANELARRLMLISTVNNPKRLPNYLYITSPGQVAGADTGAFPKEQITAVQNAGQ